LPLLHFMERCLRREHFDTASTPDKVSEDTPFDPQVQRGNPDRGVFRSDHKSLLRTHPRGELEPFHRRNFDKLLFHFRGGKNRRDKRVHGALVTDIAYQHTGVNIRYADDRMLFKILLKAFARRLTAEFARKVVDDQPRDLRISRLLFQINGTVIADMGGGVYDDLTVVGRVCIDLLVPRHTGIEAYFTTGGAYMSDRGAFYQQAILEEEVSLIIHIDHKNKRGFDGKGVFAPFSVRGGNNKKGIAANRQSLSICVVLITRPSCVSLAPPSWQQFSLWFSVQASSPLQRLPLWPPARWPPRLLVRLTLRPSCRISCSFLSSPSWRFLPWCTGR